MRPFWYKKNTKVLTYLAWCALAFVLAVCGALIGRWSGGRGLRYAFSTSFEHTRAFNETVESLVRRKIDYERNLRLFESSGSFDEMRPVDILRYRDGDWSTADLNAGTTYTIRDLLAFAKSGAGKMEERILELSAQAAADRDLGEALMQEAAQLETVLPISGQWLFEYAAADKNPGAALAGYYRALCETSVDVSARYQNYIEDCLTDSPGNPRSPCNVLYFVENQETGESYTNIDAKKMSGAMQAVSNMENMTLLFQGERTMNIMVLDTEHVKDRQISDYFMQVSFTGPEENVLLAADLEYPAGDILQSAWRIYENRRPYLWMLLAGMIVSGIIMMFLLIIMIITTGRTAQGAQAAPLYSDRMSGEILIGSGIVLITSTHLIFDALASDRKGWTAILLFGLSVAGQSALALYVVLGLIRRMKQNTLWEGSIIYSVIRGTRKVYSARARSQRLLLGFAAYFVVDVLCIRFLGWQGILLMAVISIAILLYFMLDAVGNQNVREGLKQISRGDLDYRIDVDALTGESREMGAAVNEMGEGLKKAVQDMLRNERLKAELITNVSHDLKTPLTSIINYVDLLKRENIENPRAQEYILILEQKSARLRQLTEDLIEVSKISSGNVELHPERMQLQLFFRQALGEFEERLEEKELKINAKIPRTPVWIRTDGRQLWRVFENLLGNIVKYAAPGTEVLLELTTQEGKAKAVFENTSAMPITVSADELKERFTRGDASRKTEGSGLGLSIADSLTSLLGGTFEVEVESSLFRAILVFPLDEVKEEREKN